MERGGEDNWVRRIATWLPRLADPADVTAAGQALWEIEFTGLADQSVTEAVKRRVYERAIARVSDQFDRLIPAWIERLLEFLTAEHRRQELTAAAICGGRDPAHFDMAAIVARGQVVNVLNATGESLDPHLGPLAGALGTLGRDADEELCGALASAGPGIRAAVPGLLHVLRTHGVWRWPSGLAKALGRAGEFDDRVLPELQAMLSSVDEHARHSAMSVLETLGERARPAAGQLLAIRDGTPEDRCGIIHALAKLGEPTPQVLDLLEAAIADETDEGYVRRAAAHALAELRPDPGRFVPLLVKACDFGGYLHDESLPEAAVRALGAYGPAARDALPRLTLFLEGPVKGRTVPAELARDAIERVSAGEGARSASVRVGDLPEPLRRADPPTADEPLFAVTHDDRQCYIDRQGRIVIETQAPWGMPFSEGRAVLHGEQGTTVIDRTGRVVFESRWEEIKPFREGRAAVRKGKKWGFIELDGRVVIEPQYDSVTYFSEGFAGVELGRGEERIDDLLTMTRPGRRGFINRSGEVVIAIEWVDAQPFREGRAAVCTGGIMKPNDLFAGREVLSECRHGYIDTTGRVVIEGVYSRAGHFSEGLAAVYTGELCGRERAGYVDTDGRVLIPMKYTSVDDFNSGLAVVRPRGKKWRGRFAVIDRNGNLVLEPSYRPIGTFSEGLAAAGAGDAYGYINPAGEMVIEPQFDQCEPFHNGLAEVQRGDWYGLIDPGGRFVWGPTTEGRISALVESAWA